MRSGNRRTGPVALLSLLLILAASAGCQQASGEQAPGEEVDRGGVKAEARAGDAVAATESTAGGTAGVVARAGEATAQAGARARARAGDAVVEASPSKQRGDARGATLELDGDTGTRFSGTCTVGDEEKEIGGRVPERFVYELRGRELRCEIHKEGEGALKVMLSAGDASHVQQTDSEQATIRISYSGRGFSSSVQSSSGSASASSSVSTSSR